MRSSSLCLALALAITSFAHHLAFSTYPNGAAHLGSTFEHYRVFSFSITSTSIMTSLAEPASCSLLNPATDNEEHPSPNEQLEGLKETLAQSIPISALSIDLPPIASESASDWLATPSTQLEGSPGIHTSLTMKLEVRNNVNWTHLVLS